jgi:alkylated DNA repair dioxygenase AlkB
MIRVLKCEHTPLDEAPAAKTLEARIRKANRTTMMHTDMRMKTGEECDAPAGLGVFAPERVDRKLMNDADRELVALFKQPRAVLDGFSANVRDQEFIALFWQNPGQPIYSLRDMMRMLAPHTPSLVALLESAYIPLMAQAMKIGIKSVCDASAEIIMYAPRKSGLGSHIDNVIRTHGKVGPICSINLVSKRSIDLLPTFVRGATPIRVNTDRGDLMVMDSDARILWSHSVPFHHNRYRYSVIIRPVRPAAAAGKNRGVSPFGTVIPTPTFT